VAGPVDALVRVRAEVRNVHAGCPCRGCPDSSIAVVLIRQSLSFSSGTSDRWAPLQQLRQSNREGGRDEGTHDTTRCQPCSQPALRRRRDQASRGQLGREGSQRVRLLRGLGTSLKEGRVRQRREAQRERGRLRCKSVPAAPRATRTRESVPVGEIHG
jgi:hypothetical protein